jgi:hypothetical protein
MSNPNETNAGNISIVLQRYDYDLHFTVLHSRMLARFVEGKPSYSVYRKLSFAVCLDMEEFFDDLAINLGWSILRLDEGSMLLESDGLFVQADGNRKADYCSCTFRLWADGVARAENAKAAILARADGSKIQNAMVTICWCFLDSKGELQRSFIEEVVDDVLYDEAYPELEAGVGKFISDYLESSETILVLQGKPGTGKTRLIRSILGAMTLRKGKQIRVLYTGDIKALENDEIFLKFVTGSEEAFVIEDADYILKPRADGNDNLHRFLTIADGVVRAQGRKIIFSTNLPNVGDLNDALIRPGRCFARLMVRELTKIEAVKLLARLCKEDAKMLAGVAESLSVSDRSTFSVAEIYRLYEQVMRQGVDSDLAKPIVKRDQHRIGF